MIKEGDLTLHRCVIKPRDSIREKLVKEQWQAAEKDLDSEGNFTPEFIQASFK